MAVDLFADHTWQMTFGERFAVEGVVSTIRPRLAIEIGTAEGGSLRRIAANAGEVHCFDREPAVADVAAGLPNVIAHIGDSRETLPPVLAEFERAGRNVDFALVDGEHTAEGVARDVGSLAASAACRRTVIMVHDTSNPDVRRGLESLDLLRHPAISVYLPDLVPGHLVIEDHVFARECWNGLGLFVLDHDEPRRPPIMDIDHEPTPLLLGLAREGLTPP